MPQDTPEEVCTQTMKVVNVVGTRPNFVKAAPLMEAFGRHGLTQCLVHTGQHYDREVSGLLFEDLGLPEPDINLDVKSGSHAQQTAQIMCRFEPVLEQERPDMVVVVGDVNSTIACALVAVKMGIPVAHVEAGLRSFDRSMPEEINRILTDAISHLWFASEPSAVENLIHEGAATERIHLVGNVMIDSLLRHRDRARCLPTLESFGLRGAGGRVPFAIVTLHRPSNVDSPVQLRRWLEALRELNSRIPVIFPIHPRTRRQMEDFHLDGLLDEIRVTGPMGYLEFLGLLCDAALVVTDSGGIQEETTVLGIPCLTVRDSTERPITVHIGTNRLVGSDPRKMLSAAYEILDGKTPHGRIPELWDGCAAERIAQIIAHQDLA
jgi:UDP-N-acetylglucosamine 2-epimerase (non-hydrolysing)